LIFGWDFFWDCEKRRLYIIPIPMFGFYIAFNYRNKWMEHHIRKKFIVWDETGADTVCECNTLKEAEDNLESYAKYKDLEN